jgi:hypothetical protein
MPFPIHGRAEYSLVISNSITDLGMLSMERVPSQYWKRKITIAAPGENPAPVCSNPPASEKTVCKQG